jgi:hypothetical protein
MFQPTSEFSKGRLVCEFWTENEDSGFPWNFDDHVHDCLVSWTAKHTIIFHRRGNIKTVNYVKLRKHVI